MQAYILTQVYVYASIDYTCTSTSILTQVYAYMLAYINRRKSSKLTSQKAKSECIKIPLYQK